MSEQTIKLPVSGIVVRLTGDGGGSITSELHSNTHPDFCEDEDEEIAYNHAVDGIEALILGLACAGIDITTPAFLQGIEAAVQGCAENI